MTRSILAVVGVCSLLSVTATPAQYSVDIGSPSPPCPVGQQGFAGEATDSTIGVSIRFRACGRVHESCEAQIMRVTGQVLAAVVVDDSGLTYSIGGVMLADPENLSDEQKRAITEALQFAETDVAVGLWAGLRNLGSGPDDGPAGCLWRLSQLYQKVPNVPFVRPAGCYEDCNDSAKGCVGCCGAGCTGGARCDTACTDQCRAHDEDCGANPLNHLPTDPWGVGCLLELVAAGSSWWGCDIGGGDCGGSKPACDCCTN